jgi:flavodoxin
MATPPCVANDLNKSDHFLIQQLLSSTGAIMNTLKLILAAMLSIMLLGTAQADEKLKPFILAGTQSGDVASVAKTVEDKLKSAGFEVLGEYSPYAGTTIIGVTDDALKEGAGKTDFGVFGAAMRVSVTKGKDNKIQVAYTNPAYLAAAYRMNADLSGTAAKLKQALGAQQAYGSAKGLKAADLEDYHYKWLMPYFTDRLELAKYNSYDQAVKGVEAALASGKSGVLKVYRVDIPGKEASLFAVSITDKVRDECAGDAYIMERIDFKDIKSSSHLAYEIVVKGNKAYALPAEFRIAISFPDLSMMGSNSFASIMCAPSAIEASLTRAAGGTVSEN